MCQHLGQHIHQFLYPRGDLCMMICKGGESTTVEALPQGYLHLLHTFFGHGKEQQTRHKKIHTDAQLQDKNRRYLQRFFG